MPRRKGKKRQDFRNDPSLFIDRELSWLKFNDRVLEEAEDPTNPLLERLKFLGIASSNLDEFFMVRVSGIQEQMTAQVREKNRAGFAPEEQFERVHRAAREQAGRIAACFANQVRPALAAEEIVHLTLDELSRNQRKFIDDFFHREVFPALTPLAVDSGHPFPHLRNLSLNLAVRLVSPPDYRFSPAEDLFAVVQVPSVINRIVRVPSRTEKSFEYVLLEDLIADELELLFPGMSTVEVCPFRLIRDADIEFAEEEADDLLKTIEEELRGRERGSAVRLDVEARASEEMVELLLATTGVQPQQIYRLPGPLDLDAVARITTMIDRPALQDPPFVPSLREPLRSEKNIFRAIARKDVLLHHPYESFNPVVDLIEQAAKDPNVLAIKQTLYRTSGDSPIIKALMHAAENGKQVAALMELKARFDEARNITWARQMEKAGIHVVYGLVGLKTHAKLCLIVRKEAGGIRRYVHLSTGNYNPSTARVYTDVGLLTCDPDLCDDATDLFNLLTGYSRMPDWRKMVVAPINMRETFIELIDREIEKATSGGRGRIRAKMNSLVDDEIICKLYEASCAGVQIDLIVRGICCLRPGIPEVSENIRVGSIVDRFLEHSRIYIFGEGPEERVLLASADWMPRNLDRRVEVLFPIEAPELRQRVVDEVFGMSMLDNQRRRVLGADGNYTRVVPGPGQAPLRSQQALLALEAGIRNETRAAAPTPGDILVTGTAITKTAPPISAGRLEKPETPVPPPAQPLKPLPARRNGHRATAAKVGGDGADDPTTG
jgi:polyphosphate kinase